MATTSEAPSLVKGLGLLDATTLVVGSMIGSGIFIVSGIAATNYLFGSGRYGVTTQQLLAIAVVVLLTFVNSRGIRAGALVQNVFTVAKTAALLGLVILGFAVGRNPEAVASNFTDFW